MDMKIQSKQPEKKDFSTYLLQIRRSLCRFGRNIQGMAVTLWREKSFRALFAGKSGAGRGSVSPGQAALRQKLILLLPAAVVLVLLIVLIAHLHSCSRSGRIDNHAPVVTAATTAPHLSTEQLHAAYPQNLVVIGDSIASGYHLYDFIPEEHGLAAGNAAIRSLHDYTYPYNGQENMDVTDIVAEMQPAYILMSMGMNDINLISKEEYTATYQKEIEALLEASPKTNIVVASITPIEYGNSFVSVTKLLEYNAALEEMIQHMNRSNVRYLNAFDLLADPSTLGLKQEYSAGDGIHLGTKAYEVMLNALYPLLDTMPYPENLVTEPAETTTEALNTGNTGE